MPARRSRTERWRECLQQIYERQGALEISVPAVIASGPPDTPEARSRAGLSDRADLIWRVRILALTESQIVVEQPSAAGRWIALEPGVRLVGAFAIGQNRWMFHTRVLACGVGGSERCVRLEMPDRVERCQRRHSFRISTAELSPPAVECWPLLDPESVIAAEVANRALIRELQRTPGWRPEGTLERLLLPDVGPRFHARLMNVGGGGVGLLVDAREARAADNARLLWLRVDLRPVVPAPLALTVRPVHSHVDSGRNLYIGAAFEWSHHPSHREFVVEQICRYIAALQHAQSLAHSA